MTFMFSKKGKEVAITCIFLLLLVACPLLLTVSDGIHQDVDKADAEPHIYTKMTPSAAILFQDYRGYLPSC
jgi:hypothetical protein